MARPKLDIDPDLVRKLSMIHCTTEEIAAVCDCDRTTIERRFAAELEKGRAQGKSKLRKGLWDLADRGNLGALIWLSKNHLGMSEKIEQRTENTHLIEQAEALAKLPKAELLLRAREHLAKLEQEIKNANE